MPETRRLHRVVILVILAAAVVAVYAPAVLFDFTNYDDLEYVSANPWVRAGVSPAGLAWSLTTTRMGSWHPLTWWSLMLDAAIAGVDPRMFHLTNVLLHLASTLVLFLALEGMTGAGVQSAFVAALFGVHPLHVESVAWIAERKDVLCTLPGFLAVLFYTRHAERPGGARMAPVVVFHALSLLAKPMLVTLPFLLLLLDVWPLRRAGRGELGTAAARRLVLEKLPLFALSALIAVVTLVTQQRSGATSLMDAYPLSQRLANAVVSAASYLALAVVPRGLAVLYPHPGASLAAWKIAASAALLVVLSVLAVRERRTRPYLLVGWLWYLVALLPVSGIVQVGAQAMADRYTYVPLVGIFLAVVWGLHDLLESAPLSGIAARAVLAAACASVAILGVSARVQLAHWRDAVSLWERAVRVTAPSPIASYNLASAQRDRGLLDQAILGFRETIRLEPRFASAHARLGELLLRQGNLEAAAASCEEALRLDPHEANARYNLGLVLLRRGQLREAEDQFRATLVEQPDSVDARVDLGVTLAKEGRVEEAIAAFEEAVRTDPEHDGARRNLERALGLRGGAAGRPASPR